MKALQKANAQGQRIYHLTPANQATTLPNIHQNSLVMAEIRDALNAGKEVITHTDPVSVPGWSGAGYILFDPETGDGAFKIGGGQNGGYYVIQGINLAAIGAIALIGSSITGGIVLAPFTIMLSAIAISVGLHIAVLELMFNPEAKWDDVKGNVLLAITGVLGVYGLASELATVIAFILGFVLGYESNH
ncbi:hypothetical protein ACWJKU_10895 [Methylocaldum sp. MU1018]